MRARATVAYSPQASKLLRQEAASRGLSPSVLSEAILVTVLTQGMLDAVLDGEKPIDLVSGYKKVSGDLTYRQAVVLYGFAQHCGLDGLCRLSVLKLADVVSSRADRVHQNLRALAEKGMLDRVPASGAKYRLTEKGRGEAEHLGATVFRTLGTTGPDFGQPQALPPKVAA